jgi:hypothetical protein
MYLYIEVLKNDKTTKKIAKKVCFMYYKSFFVNIL